MLDKPTVNALADLSERVATASDQMLESMRLQVEAQQTLNAVSVRVQQLITFAEREQQHLAEIPASRAQAIAPPAEPPKAAPLAAASATITDAVLDRYSETGEAPHILAHHLSCHVGLVSDILREARQRDDSRISAGNQRLVSREMREEHEPAPAPAGHSKPVTLVRSSPLEPPPPEDRTIPPDEDEVGQHIVEINYTAHTVTNLDTNASVVLKGPLARIVDRLKDQRVYGVEKLWKEIGLFASEKVFRQRLIPLNATLREIGLTIHEKRLIGMQLRKLAN